MLHLLPQYQKRKVISQYRLRMSSVVVLSCLSLVIIFIVLTLPSYLFLLYQKQSLIVQKNGFEQTLANMPGAMGEKNVDSASLAVALKPFSKSLEPSLFIDAIGTSTRGIRIDGYAMTEANPGEPVSVILSGLASTREDLTSYAQMLDKNFGGVKVPLSVLAKPGNIPFEFKFHVPYEKAFQIVGTSTLGSVINAKK